MPLAEKIKQILKEKFQPYLIEVLDDSRQHSGHPEAVKSQGGHFRLMIVSERFEGKTLIERHRMVYAALAELKDKIHALAIRAVTKKKFQR